MIPSAGRGERGKRGGGEGEEEWDRRRISKTGVEREWREGKEVPEGEEGKGGMDKATHRKRDIPL